MLTGTALAEDLAKRSLRLIVRPRPRTIYETRQVLSVIQQYGEVTHFRTQRYDKTAIRPSYIIAIYKHESAARRLIDESPLKVPLSEEAIISLERLWPADTRNQWLEPEDAGVDDEFRPAHLPSRRRPTLEQWPKEIRDLKLKVAKRTAELKKQRQRNGEAEPSDEPPDMPHLRRLSRVWAEWKKAHPNPKPRDEIHTHMEILAERSHLSHIAWVKRQPYYGPFVLDTQSRVEDDLWLASEKAHQQREEKEARTGRVDPLDRLSSSPKGIKTWPTTPEFDPITHQRIHSRMLGHKNVGEPFESKSLMQRWREGKERREKEAVAKQKLEEK